MSCAAPDFQAFENQLVKQSVIKNDILCLIEFYQLETGNNCARSGRFMGVIFLPSIEIAQKFRGHFDYFLGQACFYFSQY